MAYHAQTRGSKRLREQRELEATLAMVGTAQTSYLGQIVCTALCGTILGPTCNLQIGWNMHTHVVLNTPRKRWVSSNHSNIHERELEASDHVGVRAAERPC